MIIALLTDFGTKDWFVGVMKAVIWRINPNVKIIDISHEISPQNVTEAGFVLWNAYKYFPDRTIFVCVVDPGVGSERKILGVESESFIFLAPDNGLLDFVLSEEKILKVVSIENKNFFLEKVSSTFHGRDIFAPISAYISRGVELEELGPVVDLKISQKAFVDVNSIGGYVGKVIYIDRFGNLITNLKASETCDGEVEIKNFKIPKISKTYSNAAEGEPLALVDSSGLIEIAVRNGSAKEFFKVGYGEAVFLNVKKL